MKIKGYNIYFRNQNQVTLWNNELLGQLSDGCWENAKPLDHWIIWHNCDAKVAEGVSVGRDFSYCGKQNYNFTDKDLLNVVGQRMIQSVRLTLAGYHEAAHHAFEDIGMDYPNVCFRLPSITTVKDRLMEMVNSTDNYWRKKASNLTARKFIRMLKPASLLKCTT